MQLPLHDTNNNDLVFKNNIRKLCFYEKIASPLNIWQSVHHYKYVRKLIDMSNIGAKSH